MLTAFGQDRPGIVATVAESLYSLQCNIEDTCMTRLRGEFAMMLMVRLPSGLSPDQLIKRLQVSTQPLGLTLLCRELPAQAVKSEPATQAPIFMLSVYGADRTGIVAQVARVVASHEGNITDMNTRVIGPAERPLYVMVLEIQLPPDQSPDPLQEALDQLKQALSLDITLRPIEHARL